MGAMAVSPRTLVILALLFVAALGLRVAWLGITDTELLPLSDPQYYHATASNLADGRGYSVTLDDRGFVAGPESEATAFWAPGYSFALAPLYAVFGNDQRAAKALNAVVGALTVVPVFVLGRSLGCGLRRPDGLPRARAETQADVAQRTGLLAAALFAVAPALVYWTASLFSEPLFTFGIASTLALAVWAGDRRTIASYLLVGGALTATAFVRSQGLLMIVPVAVLLAREFDVRSLARVFAPIVGVLFLAVVPWAIRNDAAMGRPFLINSNLGYNLRIAHAPYSTGTSIPPQDLWDEQPGISFKERELLFDELGRERAIKYALDHPAREIELAFKRVGYLLRSDAEPAVLWSESLGITRIDAGPRGLWIALGDLFWYPLLLLALASLLALRPARAPIAMWSAVGVWVLLHTVFAGEPRYHVPIVPALAALAAATAVAAIASLTRDDATARGRDADARAGEPSSPRA